MSEWQLDKRVPAALIATLAVQTLLGVWWLAQLGERVNTLERRAEASSSISDRLTRVEVKVDTALDVIQDIKRRISPTYQ